MLESACASNQLACRAAWVSGVDGLSGPSCQRAKGHVCEGSEGDSMETAGLLPSTDNLPFSVFTALVKTWSAVCFWVVVLSLSLSELLKNKMLISQVILSSEYSTMLKHVSFLFLKWSRWHFMIFINTTEVIIKWICLCMFENRRLYCAVYVLFFGLQLIGCRVERIPEGSTERYTRWINTLTQEQLITQVHVCVNDKRSCARH